MNIPPHRCPACKEEAPFVTSANGNTCLKCGASFEVNTGIPPPVVPAPRGQKASDWFALLALLLTPALLALLSSLSGGDQTTAVRDEIGLSRNNEATLGVSVFSSLVAALIGSVWLPSQMNLGLGSRLGLGLLLVPVILCTCLALTLLMNLAMAVSRQ